jgi:hypothetical protein
MSGNVDKYGQHRYGSVHRAERGRWDRVVRAGGVCCWRCGKPIPAGSRWDLGHVDDTGRRQGFPARYPEHVGCNRATLPRMLARARRERPKRELDFGGLPDPTPTNGVDRWSQHWDVGRFNPRCPDCRERGAWCGVGVDYSEGL